MLMGQAGLWSISDRFGGWVGIVWDDILDTLGTRDGQTPGLTGGLTLIQISGV